MDNQNEVPEASSRPLPEVTWVTLAEALTWMAFRNALTADELRAQVEGDPQLNIGSPEERFRSAYSGAIEDVTVTPGKGHFEDREAGLLALTEVWRVVRNGSFKVRGKFSSNFSKADAHLADVLDLDETELATFSQFDASSGGISRRPLGSPEVIWNGHPEAFNRGVAMGGEGERAAGGYLFVEVERVGLSQTASLPDSANAIERSGHLGRSPAVKRGRPPHEGQILAKADEMKARGLNGRKIASEMRYEPGFENVATTDVRELIKGRYKSTGRPKEKGA